MLWDTQKIIWSKIMTFVFSINAFRNSHQRRSIKKLLLKISQYSQKIPVLESLFNKWWYLVNTARFLRAPILENIWEQMLFCDFQYRIEIFFVILDFSMLKTPTMNLEKILKIIYQKRSHFISFSSAFLTSFLLSEHLCLQDT